MPAFLTVYNVGVFRTIMLALEKNQNIRVLKAAMRLWFLNTVRAVAHYLGAFLIADSISVKMPGNLGPIIKCTMMGSFQCLDIMPILESHSFGRGESSRILKTVAAFMEAETALNICLFCLMSLMFLNFFLYSLLVADENHIRLANLEKEIKSREMMEMRVRMVQSRTHLELEQLVHDLKTPLTSILTLAGILRLTYDKEKWDIYLNSIETSVENLNEQISEILDEQRFTRITVEEFMNGLSAQVSHMPYGDMVKIEMENPESCIEVNRIRAFRMLHLRSQTIPLIVFTIDDNQEVADAFIKAGATDFALKPIKALDMISRIKLHIRLMEQVPEEKIVNQFKLTG